MIVFFVVYDIQTSYKGAVYSVKLKMEFTILNQLMNLVKGNLNDYTVSSSPHTGSKSHTSGRVTNRSGFRSGAKSIPVSKELGNSAGAYSRMDEPQTPGGTNEIRLQELKNNDVLKTTTTEVKFESVDDIESVESGRRGKGLRRSSSSEVYIIDHDRT